MLFYRPGELEFHIYINYFPKLKESYKQLKKYRYIFFMFPYYSQVTGLMVAAHKGRLHFCAV